MCEYSSFIFTTLQLSSAQEKDQSVYKDLLGGVVMVRAFSSINEIYNDLL